MGVLIAIIKLAATPNAHPEVAPPPIKEGRDGVGVKIAPPLLVLVNEKPIAHTA
jgi:hypothetical protein